MQLAAIFMQFAFEFELCMSVSVSVVTFSTLFDCSNTEYFHLPAFIHFIQMIILTAFSWHLNGERALEWANLDEAWSKRAT